MRPYLPREGMSSSPYSEGGALYALGLMYSNYDQSNKAFLLQSLRDSSSEVRHCTLGLRLLWLTSREAAQKHAPFLEDLKTLQRELTAPAFRLAIGV